MLNLFPKLKMNWTKDDLYTNVKIVETGSILEFKMYLTENPVKCGVNVGLCEYSFWLTQDQRCQMIGPCGAIGPCGPTGSQSQSDWCTARPSADEKSILVSISFKTPSSIAEKFRTHALNLTKNSIGETHRTWSIIQEAENVPYTTGVYKKPGFDIALSAIQKMKPNCTEQEFARNFSKYLKWDNDLVETRLYDGEKDCLTTFTTYETVQTGKSKVVLSLLSIDLQSNLEYIKKILSSCK